MATKVEASHQMMVKAARLKDAGRAQRPRGRHGQVPRVGELRDVVEQSFRIHGGYGYSKEYEIERLYREAPMLLIGEGTAEIQKMIIGRRLLEEYEARPLSRCRGRRASVRAGPPAGRGTARRCASRRRGTPWPAGPPTKRKCHGSKPTPVVEVRPFS